MSTIYIILYIAGTSIKCIYNSWDVYIFQRWDIFMSVVYKAASFEVSNNQLHQVLINAPNISIARLEDV